MLERLVEDLGRVALAPELGRDRGDRGLEHLREPAVHRDRLRHRAAAAAVELRAVAGEVVEEAARLVLLRVQPRERVQPPPVVAGLDDVGAQAQAVAVVARDELELVHVEAELVEAVQPVVDLVARVVGEELVAHQLVPERLVARDEVGGGLLRPQLAVPAELGLDVGELAGDVLLGDHEVVGPLPVREARVQLARLGVDEVGRERARIAAEERVRERAVAPEEAAEVEADEQLRARVEQPPAQVGDAAAGEERSERQRVVEVTRDQDRVEVGAAVGDDADRLDDGHLVGRERAQEPVLPPGQLDRQLLERVQLRPELAVVLDEANDVAVDPAHDLDEPRVLPLLERLVPGQVEEVRVAGAGDQLQPGGQLSSRGARRRASGTSRATRGAARAAAPTWPTQTSYWSGWRR